LPWQRYYNPMSPYFDLSHKLFFIGAPIVPMHFDIALPFYLFHVRDNALR
jgi:hypothetical protein